VKLLWRGSWTVAPCYVRVPRSRLIDVERSASVAEVRDASGRVVERRGAKLLRFLITDGPRATLRKARSKLAESERTGDYRVVAAVGRCADTGDRRVCIACRMPASAGFLLAHEDLSRPAEEGFTEDAFDRFSSLLEADAERLALLGNQTYLYSGQDPPSELGEMLDRALQASLSGEGSRVQRTVAILPPRDGSAETTIRLGRASRAADRLPAAVLGAGDYVRTEVVPAVKRAGLDLVALCDREPQIAATAAREAGFAFATTAASDALGLLDRPGVVVVATHHDSHAELAALALERGHRVLLEKPAVITERDLELLLEASSRSPGRLEVGFNRRYNTLLREARDVLAAESGPFTIACTVREVGIEPHHWYLWPNQGTRVAGNLCHWIDLAVFLIGRDAEPTSVTVSPRVAEGVIGDDAERCFSVEFGDGSAVFVIATGRGDPVRGVQELIEARRGSVTVRLDDLWRMVVLRGGRASSRRTLWRDKGHQRMYREALRRFTRGEPAAYPIGDLATVGSIQIAASAVARSRDARREIRLPRRPGERTGSSLSRGAGPRAG
jgi:predicted dehydrogenase